MDDDKKELVLRFCTLNLDSAYTKRYDTKACFALIKSLVDGEPPCNEPTNTYDFEVAASMYSIIPESLLPQTDKILTSWKIKVFGSKDPDTAIPVAGIDPTVIDMDGMCALYEEQLYGYA